MYVLSLLDDETQLFHVLPCAYPSGHRRLIPFESRVLLSRSLLFFTGLYILWESLGTLTISSILWNLVELSGVFFAFSHRARPRDDANTTITEKKNVPLFIMCFALNWDTCPGLGRLGLFFFEKTCSRKITSSKVKTEWFVGTFRTTMSRLRTASRPGGTFFVSGITQREENEGKCLCYFISYAEVPPMFPFRLG